MLFCQLSSLHQHFLSSSLLYLGARVRVGDRRLGLGMERAEVRVQGEGHGEGGRVVDNLTPI
jgi:hypothetical protein